MLFFFFSFILGEISEPITMFGHIISPVSLLVEKIGFNCNDTLLKLVG